MNVRTLLLGAVCALTACATEPQRSPEDQATAEAVTLCVQIYHPEQPHFSKKQAQEYEKCKADKYAELLPAYMQQEAMRRQAIANNLANINANLNAMRPRTTNCTGFGYTLNCTTY